MAGGHGRELTDDLEQALVAGDHATARRVAADLVGSSESDAALAVLARAATQSPQALELLLESLDASGVVRRFAGAGLLDKSAVDDVSQDSLISVAESIGSYGGRGKLTSWVHSIVRRRTVDYLRRQRDTVPLHEEVGPAARMSSMIATRATVQQVLAELPPTYRAPVTLRDLEGLPYAEIASKLNRPEGTVRAQVTRGRALVAARLRGGEGTAEGVSS
ncbi:RNA polymerase sigma factor [Ornithinimicrobium faecis]|uniref:RNA polymerase sigma factor n=1 Tax=Ornithinimicrobium faecis TaxID=2934158 RepID=A0ABY4YQR3_9MICO|nr:MULTISPECIES: RNA polymerase sigma factor [unclassified Ornithinimicrobium]USQ78906.1 RNA polymerase sigma factor [Ornithinimicrobium sp. HY1793]